MADEGKSTVHMTPADQLVLKAVLDLSTEFGGMRKIVDPIPAQINALVLQVQPLPEKLTTVATRIEQVQATVAKDIHEMQGEFTGFRQFREDIGRSRKFWTTMFFTLMPVILGGSFYAAVQLASINTSLGHLNEAVQGHGKVGTASEFQQLGDRLEKALTSRSDRATPTTAMPPQQIAEVRSAVKGEFDRIREDFEVPAGLYRVTFTLKSSYIDPPGVASEGAGMTLAFKVPFTASDDNLKLLGKGWMGVAKLARGVKVANGGAQLPNFIGSATIVDREPPMAQVVLVFADPNAAKKFRDILETEAADGLPAGAMVQAPSRVK